VFSDEISMVMLQGVWIGGEPRAPGERIKVPPTEAHEIALNGWAKFDRPGDAETAREAFIVELVARLRRANGSRNAGLL
jgi:hypothetical protein